MNFDSNIESPNQEVFFSELVHHHVRLFIKREDTIHPYVSGNKFRKLKYNIQEAKHRQQDTLLTFGGAYSNHILATAVAGQTNGFKTIGVIRGEELGANLNETLAQNETLRLAHSYGMQFQFVSRALYKEKETEEVMRSLHQKWGDFYLLPEGGTNALAIKGCTEILTTADEAFDYICVSAGTGGTFSGLISAALPHQHLLGFSALKGDFLKQEISTWVGASEQWELITDTHFGGYAKYTPELIHFMNQFKEETGIVLDPIYTAKMLFGIVARVKAQKFSKGSRILAIHTGGIQGIAGFNASLKLKHKELQIHT